MTTILSSFPQTPGTGTGTSCPGTPMSGISTVAIKDGHEGIRHGHHQQADPAAQERLARLGAYGNSSSTTGSVGEDGEGYFQRVAGWRDHEEGGDGAGTASPEEQRGLSEGELTGESSGGFSGDVGDIVDDDDIQTPDASEAAAPTPPPTPVKPSLTQKIADKLSPKSKLPIPPRRAPSSYLSQIPNPPCPTPATPATPLSPMKNPLSQALPTQPGPNNNPNNNLKSSSSSSTSASNGNGLVTPYSTTAPSPASTITTNSVREAKIHAKMLGPMTYDEGVVDTTLQNGTETMRSPSPSPIVLNEMRGLEGERMDLEQRGEESRKQRLEDIEERIVGGEQGPFRD